MKHRIVVVLVAIGTLMGTIAAVEWSACGPFEDCAHSEWRMRRSAGELYDIASRLYCIWASEDGRHIVAGASHLALWESDDGGETWKTESVRIVRSMVEATTAANNDDVIGIAFSGTRGVALLRSGRELEKTDQTSWQEDLERSNALAPLAPLQSAQLDDGGVRAVVASDGKVFDTIESVRPLAMPPSDAYGDWIRGPERVQVRLGNDRILVNGKNPEPLTGARAVAAAPPAIIVVGASGGSAVSTNGGRSWLKRRLPSRENFNAVWLDRRGFLALAAGEDGVILRSFDGGLTWFHVTRDPKPAMAPNGSSRPPLWAFIVNGIVVLLTLPFAWKRPVSTRRRPIERLREKLYSDRPVESGRGDVLDFSPVAEALVNLLRSPDTSLPIVIAVNGVYGSGKSSIAKMVGKRLREQELKIVWFDAWHHQSESDLLASLFESVWQSIGLDLRFRLNLVRIRAWKTIVIALAMAALFAWWSRLPGMPETFARILAIASVAYAGIQAASSSAIFGILRTIAATFRLPILDAPLGLRQRFNKALGEVTEALGDRRLIIIVDDLDRCDEEARATVLNAINFITAAADCAFILAMNRTEMKEYETLLEKIVDLDVRVPVMHSEQARRLLSDETPSRPIFDWGAIQQHVRHVVAAAVTIIIVFLICWGITVTIRDGSWQPPWPSGGRTETTALANPPPTATVSTAPMRAATVSAPSMPRAALARVRRQWLTADLAVLGVGLAVLLGVMLVRRGDAPIRDPMPFMSALAVWSDVIHAAHATPRAVKRFANRARFYALYCAVSPLAGLSSEAVVAALAKDESSTGASTSLDKSLKEHTEHLGAIDLDAAIEALHHLPVYGRGNA